MKRFGILAVAVVVPALLVDVACAQVGGRGFLKRKSSRSQAPATYPPAPSLLAALDTNRDGVISTFEMNNAAVALRSLDANNYGMLSGAEIHPPPPQTEGTSRMGSGGRRGGSKIGSRIGNRIADRVGQRVNERLDDLSARAGELTEGGGSSAIIDRIMANDKNNDGKLSKDEAPERLKQRFDLIDANSDGFVDRAELEQLIEKLRASGVAGPGAADQGDHEDGDHDDHDHSESETVKGPVFK